MLQSCFEAKTTAVSMGKSHVVKSGLFEVVKLELNEAFYLLEEPIDDSRKTSLASIEFIDD